MNLKRLCSEFWDEVVRLMEFENIEKMIHPKGRYTHEDILLSYMHIDPDFLYEIGRHFQVDPYDIGIEMLLLSETP